MTGNNARGSWDFCSSVTGYLGEKGLRCGESENSVVLCYFYSYLWETYSIQFPSKFAFFVFLKKVRQINRREEKRFWDQTVMTE